MSIPTDEARPLSQHVDSAETSYSPLPFDLYSIIPAKETLNNKGLQSVSQPSMNSYTPSCYIFPYINFAALQHNKRAARSLKQVFLI